MSITSKDVARRAKVSQITVSRVFNPRPNFPIAAATRDRVHAAARELGYRPNRLARALATGRTHVVSLYIPELSPYHAVVVRSIQKLLIADQYEMIMLIDPLRPERQDNAVPDRRLFPSDGILAVDLPGRLEAIRQAEVRQDTPIVVIGTYPSDGRDSVMVDLNAGARDAVRHLVEAGARRIGYVVWRYSNRQGDARRDAYEEVLAEAGLTPQYFPISWPARQAAREELKALIDGQLPDAFFCYSDDCAIGVFHGLRDMGVRVPEDVLLCGCDGLPDAEYLATPLTTVAQPIDDLCAQGWELLKGRMQHPERSVQQVTLKPDLVVRQSTTREWASGRNSDV